MREYRSLSGLAHPNIVKYYGQFMVRINKWIFLNQILFKDE